MKTSEVFRNAKQHLWDGSSRDDRNRFICHAIRTVRCPEPEKAKAAHTISSRLCPYWTATGWLDAQVGEDTVDAAGSVAVQAWRQAWLDQLIAEFEAKGD